MNQGLGRWKQWLGTVTGALVIGGVLSGCVATPQMPWVLAPPAPDNGGDGYAGAPSTPAPWQTVPPPFLPPRTNNPPAQQQPATYQRGLYGDYANYPAMRQFIGKMNSQHGFDLAFLEQTFSGVQRDTEALRKAGAPTEGQVWRAYSSIFLTEERIRGGVDFWNQNAGLIDSVARQTGVDPEYIVAIIGVETQYGRNTGAHNVLRALTTLGFDFPRRADFYQKELENFLLMAREERIPPQILRGSYAGAMGLGQFMPSSYRHYGVDGNRDGKRDLWNPQDAIPSVANYLAKHGWKRGSTVAVPAVLMGGGYASIAETSIKKPSRTLGDLAAAGVRPAAAINSSRVSLIRLTGTTDEYWIGGENFYVIGRYNPNVKYAMSVHQLAQAVRQRKFGF